MSKRFSAALYKEFNNFGIRTASHFLNQSGYKVIDTTEAYKSHDFIVEKDGREFKVEVEVSQKWETLSFPYQTMSVPYRKKDSQADIYIRMNRNGSALFCLPMKLVFKSPVITKNTCYTVNEKFFNVPVSSLQLCYLEDGVWYTDDEEPASLTPVVSGNDSPRDVLKSDLGSSSLKVKT